MKKMELLGILVAVSGLLGFLGLLGCYVATFWRWNSTPASLVGLESFSGRLSLGVFLTSGAVLLLSFLLTYLLGRSILPPPPS